MKKIMNLAGQIRIYSLVDLMLLLVAVNATSNQFVGSICLWIGFLLFLEAGHKHSYRKKFPKGSWIILWMIGLYFFHQPEALGFIVLSILYTQKNKWNFALISPIVRGLQTIVLLWGITGHVGAFVMLAGILITIRNLLGDIRDSYKDSQENKKTLPVLLNYKPQAKYIHLCGCFLTSTAWWIYSSGLSFLWLIIIWVIQAVSERWTPR